eukprot:TRINITY_DN1465_c0_g1_i1.p1 TRINITY_DN1465_c0_g1~~TRINITY_DN1465_c0_g1_i1.p1  ORF type:complete len:529 (-),score=92.87 TRINITY_DN1465_c0_g1_i1:83-1486(-)
MLTAIQNAIIVGDTNPILELVGYDDEAYTESITTELAPEITGIQIVSLGSTPPVWIVQDRSQIKLSHLDVFTLSGLILKDGRDSIGSGGCVSLVNISHIVIDNCVFSNCYSVENGGAVYSYIETGNISVSNCSFTNCNSVNGGGLYVADDRKNTANLASHISESIFDQNSASNQGGGIYLASGSASWVLSGITLNNNTASDGGGLYSDIGHLNISKSLVTNNQALEFGGGVCSNQNRVYVSSTLFNNNMAKKGGALAVVNGVTLLGQNLAISGCDFLRNVAINEGGALFFQKAGKGSISDCSIYENYAVLSGGGIYSNDNPPTLYNSLVQNNTLPEGLTKGAGIFISKPSTVYKPYATAIQFNNAGAKSSMDLNFYCDTEMEEYCINLCCDTPKNADCSVCTKYGSSCLATDKSVNCFEYCDDIPVNCTDNTGKIVGIIVAVAVVLIVILVGYIIYQRRKRAYSSFQ